MIFCFVLKNLHFNQPPQLPARLDVSISDKPSCKKSANMLSENPGILNDLDSDLQQRSSPVSPNDCSIKAAFLRFVTPETMVADPVSLDGWIRFRLFLKV